MRPSRLIGAAVLLSVATSATFVGDAVWNGGALFYAALGRDGLVSACTPPTLAELAKRGFTPVDLAWGDRPAISIRIGASGRSRTLIDAFTFSDGPDGPRVDGNLVCVVSGTSVRAEVKLTALPVRAA